MEFEKALGKALKDLRLSKGLTQEFFSISSSRTHMSRLENGRKQAYVATINTLANAMGVHPLSILTQAYLNQDESLNLEDLQQMVSDEIHP